MALTDYEGRTPASDPHVTVQHATHHRRWSPEETVRDDCEGCSATLDLRNRHVLVRVDVDDCAATVERRYFCRERCVAAWVGDRDPPANADAQRS